MPKLRIEESAARRQAAIDRGEEVIVGVNKYQSADAAHVDILDVDNAAVRTAQIARLDQIRQTRNAGHVEAALGALTDAARSGDGQPAWRWRSRRPGRARRSGRFPTRSKPCTAGTAPRRNR